MPVIEAQCASILVPHDHRHINQNSVSGRVGCIAAGSHACLGWPVVAQIMISGPEPVMAATAQTGEQAPRASTTRHGFAGGSQF